MKRMMYSWQDRRSRFNHDWLKNEFIPALTKWMNVLEDRVEDLTFEKEFFAKYFLQWESHSKEAICLLDDFEKEMSPRVLFNEYPLANCEQSTKVWLVEMTHTLWLARYSVEEIDANARTCIDKVNAIYIELQAAMKNCTEVREVRQFRTFRNQFKEFLSACSNLGMAIERFPNKIVAV